MTTWPPRARSARQAAPSRDELLILASEIKAAIHDGRPTVIKALLGALVDSVHVNEHKEAFPYFRVPAGAEKSGPFEARTSYGIPLRMGSHHVEVAGIEP